MGQTLSSPATQKFTETGGNDRFSYAVSEMQGWRITMEDTHAIILDLDEVKEQSNTFFAVYDGHGGGSVAKFAGQNVHKRLLKEESYNSKDYQAALKQAFIGTDEDLLADPSRHRDPSGCTAVAALVTHDNTIYVANAGDSRSVISVNGEVKPLSFDHKPSNEVEKTRISEAGGYIECGRVNGNLALSRALGDFQFKTNKSLTAEKQIITADPDVTVHEITDDDEFFVLACDGIWDCLSSQEVVDFVRRNVSEGKELSEIGELMCDHLLAPDTSSGAGIGCDNMTVLIIAILHGRTTEEWYKWVTDRVNNGDGYNTPKTIPQIYSQSRLMSFRARREAQEARDKARRQQDESGGSGILSGSSTLSGFAKVLGSTGGMSFNSASGIIDTGALMFGSDESDDDSGEETEADTGRSFFSETLGLGNAHPPDTTEHLKSKLDDFEKDMLAENVEFTLEEEDGSDEQSSPFTRDESPHETSAPPRPLINGDAKEPVEQLKSHPEGDEPSPALKAEGLLDKSEDPLKT